MRPGLDTGTLAPSGGRWLHNIYGTTTYGNWASIKMLIIRLNDYVWHRLTVVAIIHLVDYSHTSLINYFVLLCQHFVAVTNF